MATQQGRAKHGSQAWQRERKKWWRMLLMSLVFLVIFMSLNNFTSLLARHVVGDGITSGYAT